MSDRKGVSAWCIAFAVGWGIAFGAADNRTATAGTAIYLLALLGLLVTESSKNRESALWNSAKRFANTMWNRRPFQTTGEKKSMGLNLVANPSENLPASPSLSPPVGWRAWWVEDLGSDAMLYSPQQHTRWDGPSVRDSDPPRADDLTGFHIAKRIETAQQYAPEPETRIDEGVYGHWWVSFSRVVGEAEGTSAISSSTRTAGGAAGQYRGVPEAAMSEGAIA